MSLTCERDGGDECEWYYHQPKDFSTLNTKRSRKCCSCGTKIKPSAPVLPFDRFRPAASDVEERIHGGEVPLATMYMCEKCGDQAMNLNELGYATPPGENMFDLLAQYVELQKGVWRVPQQPSLD